MYRSCGEHRRFKMGQNNAPGRCMTQTQRDKIMDETLDIILPKMVYYFRELFEQEEAIERQFFGCTIKEIFLAETNGVLAHGNEVARTNTEGTIFTQEGDS
jgi:hypothetical protein